jgi:hypothetical protein
MSNAHAGDLPMLNATDRAYATLQGPDQAPTADLLPVVDWSQQWTAPRNIERIPIHQGNHDTSAPSLRQGWLISRDHNAVTIHQGGNIIRIPAEDALEFLNAFERLLGGAR